MAQLSFSVKIVVLVLFSWSDAATTPIPPQSETLPVGKAQLEKSSTDNISVVPSHNVIVDSNKLKDKKLLGMDDSTLVKLKGYKVIPKDSEKTNIMKILFPKKELSEKISKNIEVKPENKTDDQIISTIKNSDAKDLAKDFVEVDDILLVRDPTDVDFQIDNILGDEEDNFWTTQLPFTIEMTEKPLNELTLAERLKHASKRRMLNKLAKMEVTLKQRELVKREDTPSDASKANEAATTKKPESETISATLDNKQADSQATTTESSKATENQTENPSTKKNETDDKKSNSTDVTVGAVLSSGIETSDAENGEDAVLGSALETVTEKTKSEDSNDNSQSATEEQTNSQKEPQVGASISQQSAENASDLTDPSDSSDADADANAQLQGSDSAQSSGASSSSSASSSSAGASGFKSSARNFSSRVAQAQSRIAQAASRFGQAPSSSSSSASSDIRNDASGQPALGQRIVARINQAVSQINQGAAGQASSSGAADSSSGSNSATGAQKFAQRIAAAAARFQADVANDASSSGTADNSAAGQQAFSQRLAQAMARFNQVVSQAQGASQMDQASSSGTADLANDASSSQGANSAAGQQAFGQRLAQAMARFNQGQAASQTTDQASSSGTADFASDASSSQGANSAVGQQAFGQRIAQAIARFNQGQAASQTTDQASSSGMADFSSDASSSQGANSAAGQSALGQRIAARINQAVSQINQGAAGQASSSGAADSSSGANSAMPIAPQQSADPLENARTNLMRLLQNQGHPLLSRILLGVNDSARQAEAQLPQLPALPQLPQIPALPQSVPLRPGLIAGPLVPLAQMFRAPGTRSKKHAKRATKEEDIFVTPKPFDSLAETTTTKRPRLLERYRAMSSAEKAEKFSKTLEKIMHGVTIAGHVDGYLTNRAKESIKKLHKIFKTSEEN
ncbi:actin cytoskeleton-regulatory complex protein PAN1-like isoform X1 [Contarinia nasturtii]|uniref:actin cytoskeleton-regulatory complex protein PAN1-like isoform X1 n=1 Tax=Contarinia nasturtii TaxID=265458 RepID=UPI0012D400BF|nr:actin cytoskeleton-regulatory complex protein PAN1-like isoform X1 [Contarinia nasturtii]